MSLRLRLASWCLRLALRLDPDLPLHLLRDVVSSDRDRGMRGTWIVYMTFPDFHKADAFHSWVVYARDGEL